MSLDTVTKMGYVSGMETKRRGRPPKHGEAMTGAERTQRWREKKRAEQRRANPKLYWQQQEHSWLSSDKKRRLEAIEKTVKRHPKVMKEYLVAAINHRALLKLAVEQAKRGMFSSESIALVEKTHAEIAELMDTLQDAIKANPR